MADVTPPDNENELGQTGHLIDEQVMWARVRKIIMETSDLAAQKVRIPQIASLKSLYLPVAPMPFSTIIDAYETKNPSNKKTKRQNLEPIRNLIAFTSPPPWNI